MDSKYTTVVVNNTPEIDPGDTIKLDLYWSGAGIPDENHLYMSYNQSLLDERDPGEIKMFVRQGIDKNTGDVFPLTGNDHKQVHEIELPATMIGIVEAAFYPHPNSPTSKGLLPSRVLEESHDNHPPAEIRINSDPPKWEGGDYSISLVFTYKSGNDVLQDYQKVPIHVNSWWERNRTRIEVLGIFGVIASIGLLLISAGIIPP